MIRDLEALALRPDVIVEAPELPEPHGAQVDRDGVALGCGGCILTQAVVDRVAVYRSPKLCEGAVDTLQGERVSRNGTATTYVQPGLRCPTFQATDGYIQYDPSKD